MRVAVQALGVNDRWVRGYHLWEANFHPVEKLYILGEADKGR